eukprot:UN12779
MKNSNKYQGVQSLKPLINSIKTPPNKDTPTVNLANKTKPYDPYSNASSPASSTMSERANYSFRSIVYTDDEKSAEEKETVKKQQPKEEQKAIDEKTYNSTCANN